MGLAVTTADPYSVGNSELVIGCLQAAIVEERDLHRRVRGQAPMEEMLDLRMRGGNIGLRAYGYDLFVELLVGDAGRNAHPAIRRKGTASRER